MSNDGIVTIQGKEYVTVAKRVQMAHERNFFRTLETQVISHDPVVIKATVTIHDGATVRSYSGISSVALDSAKFIEKQNPYEVAETSAVGRALGFAGYGVIESIASADEMVKSQTANNSASRPVGRPPGSPNKPKENGEPLPWENGEATKAVEQKLGIPAGETEQMRQAVDESLQEQGDTPACSDCGEPTEFRTGTSKTGKPWKGYFCTSGDKHTVKWVS